MSEGEHVQENPVHAGVCGGRVLVSDADRESGREAEFSRLVLPRQARMLRTIWRIVRDPDLAEDALQDALTTLWRKLPVLARHPNPEALVLRVCLDAACDQLRAHTRRRRRLVPFDEGEDAVSASQATQTGESSVVDEVRWAIGRLHRRQATALLLRAVRDESYQTIARSLGCSEATARVHVLRAREKLRRWLPHLCRPSRQEVSQ